MVTINVIFKILNLRGNSLEVMQKETRGENMKSLSWLLGIMAFLGFSDLVALPAQVIIVRHGEKPPEGVSLSLKGHERAQAFVPFFKGDPRVTKFGTPVAVFAQGPIPEFRSLRSVETVTPLANSLGMSVRTQFSHLEYGDMAAAILNNPEFDGKMVLVSWEHHVIPNLARQLGAQTVPSIWPGDVFDRLWVINYNPDGYTSFQNLPQQLLYGDSPQ